MLDNNEKTRNPWWQSEGNGSAEGSSLEKIHKVAPVKWWEKSTHNNVGATEQADGELNQEKINPKIDNDKIDDERSALVTTTSTTPVITNPSDKISNDKPHIEKLQNNSNKNNAIDDKNLDVAVANTMAGNQTKKAHPVVLTQSDRNDFQELVKEMQTGQQVKASMANGHITDKMSFSTTDKSAEINRDKTPINKNINQQAALPYFKNLQKTNQISMVANPLQSSTKSAVRTQPMTNDMSSYMPQTASKQNGDNGMDTKLMKFFFAFQSIISIVMVVLLVMIFNMFSSFKNQAINTDNMKSIMQSFVDSMGSQNKAFLDTLSQKLGEMQSDVGKLGDSIKETNNTSQESLNGLTKKLDRLLAQPRRAAPPPKAPVRTEVTPQQLPAQPQIQQVVPLPNLDTLPLPTSPALPSSQIPQNFNLDQLPPLPEPSPNLFPNN